eukprot:5033366-Pleurochrysis_carterae.AAC.2
MHHQLAFRDAGSLVPCMANRDHAGFHVSVRPSIRPYVYSFPQGRGAGAGSWLAACRLKPAISRSTPLLGCGVRMHGYGCAHKAPEVREVLRSRFEEHVARTFP